MDPSRRKTLRFMAGSAVLLTAAGGGASEAVVAAPFACPPRPAP